ncbi:MAG: 7-cyano-7-deazaguanine synthase [Candidatus Omnitrophota bacterium]
MENDRQKVLISPKAVCVKCVLPESKPDIWLDSQGVCNICREHEKSSGRSQQTVFLETEFVKLLNQNQTKGPYDCLVMCSGGKDSTASLYYMKKRYKRNPLAFTFDHGFETDDAMDNVRKAVDILGVDHIIFRSDFMKDMFADIARTGSKAVICHPCSIWYMQLTFDVAARYDIPVIIAGWTKGQATKQPCMSRCGCNVHQQEFISMAKATQSYLDGYIKKNPKYKDFPRSMEEVLARAKKKHHAIVLSPHWFLPVDQDSYVEVIKKELKWEFPAESYPAKTTNCALNFLSVYNSMKNFGYTHYHVEMSKMIRDGLMSRDDALKLLEINFTGQVLDRVLDKLEVRK